ncbi:hypothetical protein T439DRAFT_329697 [Meredithblackwellia eburnea MCA 4105]
MTTVTEAPAAGANEFWLKTASVEKGKEGRFTGLYLRLYGNGITSVVVTASPPVFLRWHTESCEGEGPAVRLVAVPWKCPSREFGLCVRGVRAGYGWECVDIVEGGGGGEMEWDGDELLCSVDGFGGWMVGSWVHGHAQLFSVSDGGLSPHKMNVPDGFEMVKIVREWLVPRIPAT